MQGQKTLSLSYNMHLFLPYLLNDFFQTLSLHDTNLRWSVGLVSFSFHLAVWLIKQRLWAQCCFVYSVTGVTGKTAVFTAPKAAPSGKEWISINIFNSDQHEKTNKSGGYMLMFHFDINMQRLEIHFKNDSFQWFRVNSLFERQ